MTAAAVDRPSVEVDIACVGFGPAMGGFLTTLSPALGEVDGDGQPVLSSRAMPGMPLQVICYERADDLAFGVSGVVTRARALRATFQDLDPAQIPLAHEVQKEQVLYLLDPVGASRRSLPLRAADRALRLFGKLLRVRDHAFALPWIPPFLRKHDGLILGIGQFNQWVAGQLMAAGQVQLWPGAPVKGPQFEGDQVTGVRLCDQGTDRQGNPDVGFMPGMDVHAALTVVGDGPVGPVGRQLDERFGLPAGHERRDWAVGMKMVVELRPDCELQPGTVLHTLGYPEPEIFGFLYVNQPGLASLGIFVPSTLQSPVRTSYRYLQHWMRHPALWRHLQGGKLRSWGAKTLLESGLHGEPHLCGDGYARIGEASGSTNVLTGSGVDEAWATGVQLAEGVLALLRAKEPFTKANLERTYVASRRQSWVEREGRIAERARHGFQKGFLRGVLGMALSGLTGGRLNWPGDRRPASTRLPSLTDYFKKRIPPDEIERIQQQANTEQKPLHDLLMDRAGWPVIPQDGQLLVSQQDALLLGGKVQAPPGGADHVVFVQPELCAQCGARLCIEICSGQALTPGEADGVPAFDREKCVHCGACQWSCPAPRTAGSEVGALVFTAGAGGLHSAEN
ncbi:MAG: 4Fe-4S binding protein [Planctomycetota bacterium]|jgi:electron-transferring-flavoprotein dehydrogenase